MRWNRKSWNTLEFLRVTFIPLLFRAVSYIILASGFFRHRHVVLGRKCARLVPLQREREKERKRDRNYGFEFRVYQRLTSILLNDGFRAGIERFACNNLIFTRVDIREC